MLALVGGSGFIGSRLAARLQQAGQDFAIQDKVVATAFPEQTTQVDVRDRAGLLQALQGADCIINLAAEHADDVQPTSLYYDVNVQGARNLCSVAEELGIERIIFTSSVAVYNLNHDYGKSKWQAEEVFRQWQAQDSQRRSLVIVRPTVVFGEGNRGNVYNLFRQIASGRFVMLGDGTNVKSMAYVENVAAFLQHCLAFDAGVFTYNYVDQPDMDMNSLVTQVRSYLGKGEGVGLRLPYAFGWLAGLGFDVLAGVTGRRFPISRLRVEKFCATTQFSTSVDETGFTPPVALQEGLQKTLKQFQ